MKTAKTLRGRFPDTGEHVLSTGLRCKSPFSVPRMAGAMLFGTADGDAAAALLRPEDLHPVRFADGRAAACLWLSDFLDSTVGPYRELTVTLIVAEEPRTRPWINAYSPIAAQLDDTLVCEYVLLLDNPHAIAYGRELHGFDKHPGELAISHGDGRFTFAVHEGAELAVRGSFAERGLVTLAQALGGIARAYGPLRTVHALGAPFLHMPVITPRTVARHRSELYFAGKIRLAPWGKGDTLEPGPSRVGALLARLAFQPTAVQRVLSGEGLMPLPSS